MERSVGFDDNIYQMDSDYENMGEDEPGQDSILQFAGESAVSSQRCPETFQMEVFMEDTDSEQTSSLQRHNWSAATWKVISSMPSVTAGRNSTVVIPRRRLRTPRLHQHQALPRGSSRPLRPIQAVVEEMNMEETKREQVLCSLRGLEVRDGVRKLRGMPLSLANKMELRRLAFSGAAESLLASRNFPCCARLRVYISRTWRRCWLGSVLGSLRLWREPLKRLSARFGSGVLSYFLFLRMLLCYNLLLFLTTGLFVVLPQAMHAPRRGPRATYFDGMGLLTGTGYFSQSMLFYGYYTNTTSACPPGDASGLMGCTSYSIPAAYFFTIGVTFFATCIVLVYSMSKSFGRSFHVLKSNRNLAVKVFCSWDFNFSKKTSIRLQSEKISTQLKELLSDMVRGKVEKSCRRRLATLVVHLLTWAMSLGSIFTSVVGLYYLPEVQPRADKAELLYLPAVVSGVNLLVPGIFLLCAWLERHFASPSVCVYVSIFRNLLLKVSIVGVLCYHWQGKAAESRGSKCWESRVGQELYRLLLMDFIFTAFHNLVGELLWRLFAEHMLKRKRKPPFDIARHVLELIYGQTLTWLGVLFAPLLPAVQILKLFVLFYMKQRSVMLNCQVSRRSWRASQMTTLFLSLLFFPSFLYAAVAVFYTMWTIKPSLGCGPFRNLSTMFQFGRLWIQQRENSHPVLSWLNFLVAYPVFLFLASGVFLLVIYFHSQVVDGQRKIIARLQKQIENEGKDKNFLITKLQELYEQDGLTSTHDEVSALH